MTEPIPTKKLNGLPPLVGAFNPTRKEANMSNINRRAVLAGAAATLPAVAAVPIGVAATLSEPDPILAAIEVYKSNNAAFLARCRYEGELEEKGIRLARAIDDYRTPEMVALVDAGIAARVAIAETVPTTPAGLAVTGFLCEQATEPEDPFFFQTEEISDVPRLARCRSPRHGGSEGCAARSDLRRARVASLVVPRCFPFQRSTSWRQRP
jgi:hypothetical protein